MTSWPPKPMRPIRTSCTPRHTQKKCPMNWNTRVWLDILPYQVSNMFWSFTWFLGNLPTTCFYWCLLALNTPNSKKTRPSWNTSKMPPTLSMYACCYAQQNLKRRYCMNLLKNATLIMSSVSLLRFLSHVLASTRKIEKLFLGFQNGKKCSQDIVL